MSPVRDPLVMNRLMQVGAAITNEALTAYVTRPDQIGAISEVLAKAYRDLGIIASGGVGGNPCDPGYCLKNNRCEPCELIVGNSDPQSRRSNDDRLGKIQDMILTLSRMRDEMA